MTETTAFLRDAILAALATVIDPEVGLDVVSLGLIYDLDISPEEVRVGMTLTTPGCPLGEIIQTLVTTAVRAAAPGRTVRVERRWDPPWSPAMLLPGVRP